MSGTPDAVIQTTTTVDAHPTDDHDGLLPEPTREDARVLWRWLVACLCIVILMLAGTFVYLAVVGKIGSDALVGTFGMALAALIGLYRRPN